MQPRDASQLLYPAVYATVMSLDIDRDGKDGAAAKLALQYARTIDAEPPGKTYFAAIRWLGPELQKILESLGATPAARAAMKTGTTTSGNAPVSKLDELRAARRA
jgi:hypothetical protein